MNLEFVLPGSLTMALKGEANPGWVWKKEKEDLHWDQSLLLSGSLAALEQMGVGGSMSPLRFRIQSGCCCSVHTGRWCLCVRGLPICISVGREAGSFWFGFFFLFLCLLTAKVKRQTKLPLAQVGWNNQVFSSSVVEIVIGLVYLKWKQETVFMHVVHCVLH